MPLIAYKDWRPSASSWEVVDLANRICADYKAQGFDLTLRQLYYQFVARDLIPNNERSYKRLGSIVNDARLAGLLDWNFIVDRTRGVEEPATWEDPASIVQSAAASFQLDLWADQPEYVEVWVEKDALVGVVSRICDELRVPYVSCRGYVSQSEAWRAGRRMGRQIDSGKSVSVIHLGDHDPSGLDMSRDVEERLLNFVATDCGPGAGRMIELDRIALNWDQIRQYRPPPNPAKITDSRARAYIAEYGHESWELDALEPSVLADLIRVAVLERRDEALWAESVERESEERKILHAASDRWDEVKEFLS